jgi:hypothetical protein
LLAKSDARAEKAADTLDAQMKKHKVAPKKVKKTRPDVDKRAPKSTPKPRNPDR